VTVAQHDDGEPYGHRVDIDFETQTVTRVWRGSSPYLEVGAWKMAAATVDELDRGGRSANSEQGAEFRALATLQGLVESGLPLGYVRTPAWIHLGGTKPSPEYHLRRVFETLAPELVRPPESQELMRPPDTPNPPEPPQPPNTPQPPQPPGTES
jgi:hypothetical protein